MAQEHDQNTHARQPVRLDLEETLREAARKTQAGETAAARQLFEKVLTAFPDDPDAHHNLGVLTMLEGGSPTAAIPHFRAAWTGNPGHAQFGLSYIRALLAAGQQGEAGEVHAEGLRRGLSWPPLETLAGPSKPAAQRSFRNIGQTQFGARRAGPDRALVEALQNGIRRNDWAAVEPLARSLSAQSPDHGFGWKALGLTLWRLGRANEALAPLQTATRLDTKDPEGFSILGRVLHALNLLPEAESALRDAVRLRSGSAEDLAEWGQVLGKLNRYMECENALRKALDIRSDLPKARFLLGCALMLQDKPDKAITHFERLLATEPANVMARKRLIDCLEREGRQIEIEDIALAGLAIDPGAAPLHTALAELYTAQGRLTEAEHCHRKVLEVLPEDLSARSSLLFLGHLMETSPEARLQEACEWGRIASARASRPFTTWLTEIPPQRLRVGLVSGDLREHPVGHFLETVLAHAGASQIDWIAYPTMGEMDDLSVRLRKAMTDWRPLTALSDDQAAATIRADGIHVLIDLSGHTTFNRLPVFAWRPAPVQLSWLGYFATTGLPAIDYVLADKMGVPAENRDQFVEQVHYLPETRLCFSPPDTDEPLDVMPARDRQQVCFGSFQRLAKINDRVLDAWAAILKAVPDARLRLQNSALSGASARTELLSRLTMRGIDANRVSLHGGMSRDRYLAAHAEVDIILDTFPYPGGTTTCEALWMGVPTVSLSGITMIERQGASILDAAGLGEWIAHDVADYVAKAVEHASDRARLATLREGLRERVQSTALFDADRFARHLGEALWSMWKTHEAAQPAAG